MLAGQRKMPTCVRAEVFYSLQRVVGRESVCVMRATVCREQ